MRRDVLILLKTFTAAALLTAASAKGIPTSERLGNIVKGLPPGISAITLHQLLTHSSGIKDQPDEYGLHDLSQLAIALLGHGKSPAEPGKQIIPASVTQSMMTRNVNIRTLADPEGTGHQGYCYGLFTYKYRGAQVFEHAGSMPGFAALIRLVPAERFAVVILSNNEAPGFGKTAEKASMSLDTGTHGLQGAGVWLGAL
jgi:CubicO group peptidase (beta-lactamase class C family)